MIANRVAIVLGLILLIAPGMQDGPEIDIIIEPIARVATGEVLKVRITPPTARVRTISFRVDDVEQQCVGRRSPFECVLSVPEDVALDHKITIVADVVDYGPVSRSTRASVASEEYVTSVAVWARFYDTTGRLQSVDRKAITVRDDGVRRPVECERGIEELNVVLALDLSGSIRRNLPEIQTQLDRFIGGLKEKDSISLLTFDRTLHSKIAGANRTQARAAIKRLTAGGESAVWENLARASSWFGSHGTGNFLFLITDGGDRLSGQTPLRAEGPLGKRDVVTFITLLPGGNPSATVRDELRTLARNTTGEYGAIGRASELAGELNRQLTLGRDMYLCRFEVDGPPDGRKHTLSVEVAGQAALTVNARPHYWARR